MRSATGWVSELSPIDPKLRHDLRHEAFSIIPETIGVLIATYRRPFALLRCIAALKTQTHPVDDVLVVVREDDVETRASLFELELSSLPIRIITVFTPGTVAARNAGLAACRTDVVAIIDDDTAPHPDWLGRVLKHFQSDAALGGLGGKDRCFGGTKFDDRRAPVVGKIQWFGRVIGNHHLGFGAVREVDLLKGANMSYRWKAIADLRFDTRLRGIGSQPAEDFCFSVAVKCRGWKLLYDPIVVVDHYADDRSEIRYYVGVMALKDRAAFRDFAYNQVLAVWPALSPLRKVIFLLWSILVGSDVFPGIVQAIRFTLRLGTQSWVRFGIAQQGKIHACRDIMFSQPLSHNAPKVGSGVSHGTVEETR